MLTLTLGGCTRFQPRLEIHARTKRLDRVMSYYAVLMSGKQPFLLPAGSVSTPSSDSAGMSSKAMARRNLTQNACLGCRKKRTKVDPNTPGSGPLLLSPSRVLVMDCLSVGDGSTVVVVTPLRVSVFSLSYLIHSRITLSVSTSNLSILRGF